MRKSVFRFCTGKRSNCVISVEAESEEEAFNAIQEDYPNAICIQNSVWNPTKKSTKNFER